MIRLVVGFVLLALTGVYGTPAEPVDKDAVLLFDSTQGNNLEGGIVCTLCEDVMKIVHAFLHNPNNKASILKFLEELCQYVPIFKDKCSSLVEEYGSIILDLADKYIQPSLCKAFHICAAGQAMNYKENCRVCELSTGVIHDTLQDPELPERMKKYTMELCLDYLSSAIMCAAFADEVVGNALPVVEELKRSQFFLNACKEAEICSQ